MNIKRYKSLVSSLGCIVPGCESPAVLHHPLFAKRGLSSRAPDWLVIPLCPGHHNQGTYGQCIHNGTRAFEANIDMTEQEMLGAVIKVVVGMTDL